MCQTQAQFTKFQCSTSWKTKNSDNLGQLQTPVFAICTLTPLWSLNWKFAATKSAVWVYSKTFNWLWSYMRQFSIFSLFYQTSQSLILKIYFICFWGFCGLKTHPHADGKQRKTKKWPYYKTIIFWYTENVSCLIGKILMPFFFFQKRYQWYHLWLRDKHVSYS